MGTTIDCSQRKKEHDGQKSDGYYKAHTSIFKITINATSKCRQAEKRAKDLPVIIMEQKSLEIAYCATCAQVFCEKLRYRTFHSDWKSRRRYSRQLFLITNAE